MIQIKIKTKEKSYIKNSLSTKKDETFKERHSIIIKTNDLHSNRKVEFYQRKALFKNLHKELREMNRRRI